MNVKEGVGLTVCVELGGLGVLLLTDTGEDSRRFYMPFLLVSFRTFSLWLPSKCPVKP
jgi:hypothetical protein